MGNPVTYRTFSVGDESVDIPTENAESFLKDYPDAKEYNSFIIGKDTVDIPLETTDAFKKDYPDAKPLYPQAAEPVKKKVSAATSGTPFINAPGYSENTPQEPQGLGNLTPSVGESQSKGRIENSIYYDDQTILTGIDAVKKYADKAIEGVKIGDFKDADYFIETYDATLKGNPVYDEMKGKVEKAKKEKTTAVKTAVLSKIPKSIIPDIAEKVGYTWADSTPGVTTKPIDVSTGYTTTAPEGATKVEPFKEAFLSAPETLTVDAAKKLVQDANERGKDAYGRGWADDNAIAVQDMDKLFPAGAQTVITKQQAADAVIQLSTEKAQKVQQEKEDAVTDYFDNKFGSDWEAIKQSYGGKVLEGIAQSVQQVNNGINGKSGYPEKDITDIFSGALSTVFQVIPQAQVFMASQTMLEQADNAFSAVVTKDKTYLTDPEKSGPIKKIIDWGMTLPSASLESVGAIKKTKNGSWQENVGSFFDTAWQLALLHGIGQVKSKIEKNVGGGGGGGTAYTAKDLKELSAKMEPFKKVSDKVIKKEPLTNADVDEVIKAADDIIKNPKNVQAAVNANPDITPEEKQQFNDKVEYQRQLDELQGGAIQAPPIEPGKTLFDLSGKEVAYNGVKGTLFIDQGGKVTVETNNVIHEINATGNDLAKNSGIELYETIKEEPKYNVQVTDENNITVNDIPYKVVTDEKGNITGLDNGTNVIKNIDNTIIKDVPIEQIHEEVRNQSGLSDSENTLVDGILNNNMSETVDAAIEKLDKREFLQENEKLAIELWAMDAIERLDNAKENIAKSGHEHIENLKQGISNILKLAGDEKVSDKVEAKGAQPETKKAVVGKPKRASKSAKKQEVKKETPEQPQQPAEVIPKLKEGELPKEISGMLVMEEMEKSPDGTRIFKVVDENGNGKFLTAEGKEVPQAAEPQEKIKVEPINNIKDKLTKGDDAQLEAELPPDQVNPEPKLSPKEQAKKDLDDANAAFQNKARGNIQLGGFAALPEFAKVVKALIRYGYESLVEVMDKFKRTHPGIDIDDKDFKEVFNKMKDEVDKENRITEKEVKGKYEAEKDVWLGNIDEKHLEANSQAANFQKEIQDNTPKGTKWRDIDKAIHIYLDTKRNPEHYEQFYENLTPAQKKIADLSQNLTSEQKAIANRIDAEYKKVAKESTDAGIIKETLDNYVARAWDFKNKPVTEVHKTFAVSTKHSLQRSLETILEGQAKGYDLKVEGATNNLAILKQEIANVIENKSLIDEGSKVPIGEKVEGEPQKKLFMTYEIHGYKRINNPSFKKWDYTGKVTDQEEAQLLGQRKDIVVTKDGTILQKKDVYAPTEVAKNLNNILGTSALKGHKLLDAVRRFNSQVKQTILTTSLFHHIAFLRNKYLSGAFNKIGDLSPKIAYKQGLNEIHSLTPEVRMLVRNGLTIGKIQDWDETALQEKGRVQKVLEKWKVTKPVSDKISTLIYQQKHFLFDNFGAGLKAFDAINHFKKLCDKYPDKDPNDLAKQTAEMMNDNYGGINLKRIGRNPTTQDALHLLLLAPDWTESNLRMFVRGFKGGYEGDIARRMWAKVILRGVSAIALTNLAISLMSDPNDKSDNPIDNAKERFKKAWKEGNLNWTKIDVSPLAHSLGAPKDKDYYFSVFGHYSDPPRLILSVFNPKGGTGLKFFVNKGSVITKIAGQALTSEDWKGQEYTSVDELLGLDPDKYKKTTEKHEVGEQKIKAGTLVKPSDPFQKAHQVSIQQLPSFSIEQIRGTMPMQISNLWQYFQGESDGFIAITNSAGLGITEVSEPKEAESETDKFKAKVAKAKMTPEEKTNDLKQNKVDRVTNAFGTTIDGKNVKDMSDDELNSNIAKMKKKDKTEYEQYIKDNNIVLPATTAPVKSTGKTPKGLTPKTVNQKRRKNKGDYYK